MTWNVDDTDSADIRIARLEAAVAELQRRVAELEAGSGAQQSGQVSDAGQDPWSVPPWPEVVRLLNADRKIEAIKVYREHTGVGLKEAKDVVEEVDRRMR